MSHTRTDFDRWILGNTISFELQLAQHRVPHRRQWCRRLNHVKRSLQSMHESCIVSTTHTGAASGPPSPAVLAPTTPVNDEEEEDEEEEEGASP